MIELPEAVNLADQMNHALQGKQIESCLRGNAPHKFAFYSRTPEEYAAFFEGKVFGEARHHTNHILISFKPEHFLVLGGGGERIQLHQNETTLPKKHQFLLRFTDGTLLTVTIQMWGSIQLLTETELNEHAWIPNANPSPLTTAFSYAYFNGLFEALEPGDKRFIKYFMISKPGVWGLGNGYLHDILFQARIHPRRRAISLSEAERQELYAATRDVLTKAIELGGRDDELNLFGCPGHYARILSNKSAGEPCPECETPIEKISFLGGASYFCPRCQI
jgi:formamidopyrimidine-DNA glycosylase